MKHDIPRTATVREDSKGQKNVTIPADSDLKGGDSIKFKPTESYGVQEIKEAVNEALENYSADKMPDYDLGQTVDFQVHVCTHTSGRDACGYQALREKQVKEHIQEAHDPEEVEDLLSSFRVVPVYELSTGLFTEIVRELDLENKDLYSENVIERLDEISNSEHPPERKIAELNGYIEELADL